MDPASGGYMLIPHERSFLAKYQQDLLDTPLHLPPSSLAPCEICGAACRVEVNHLAIIVPTTLRLALGDAVYFSCRLSFMR